MRDPFKYSRYERYNSIVSKHELVDKLFIHNYNELPSLNKITLHITSKKLVIDKKNIILMMYSLKRMASKHPNLHNAKTSIATYKLREGILLSCSVTLVNSNMYNFYDKLVTFSIPKLHNFKGYKESIFATKNSLNIGFKDLYIFPEIESESDKYTSSYGLDVNIVLSSRSEIESKYLLNSLQFPFKLN